MLGIAEQLARYGDRVVDEVPEVTGADVRAASAATTGGSATGVAPAPESITARQSHRNRWLAAAAVVAVLAVVAGALALGDDDGDDVITTPDPTVVEDDDPTFGYAPGWHELDPGPLTPRDDSEVMWTGTELLVFGGWSEVPEMLTDGAAYDPVDKSWRTMAPMPPDLEPSDSVWAGTELIVLGATDESDPQQSAWAYDPAGDAWRELAPPPARPLFPVLNDGPSSFPTQGGGVWTGERAVMFGPHASYDPATDTWTPLAAPPPFEVGDIAYDFVWNGTDAVFWTWDATSMALFSYRPATDEWHTHETPLDGDYLTLAPGGAAGSSVTVARDNPGGRAGILDLEDGTWLEVDRPGDTPVGCGPDLTLQGRPVFQMQEDGPDDRGHPCGDGMLLDESGEWIRLPFEAQPIDVERQLVSTDDVIFEWVSYTVRRADDQLVAGTSSLRLWVPPPLDELPIVAAPTTLAPTTTSTLPTTTTALPTTTTMPPPTTVPAPPVTVPPWSGEDGTFPELAVGAGAGRWVSSPNFGQCGPQPDLEDLIPCGDPGPLSTSTDLPRLTMVAGDPFVVAVAGQWDEIFLYWRVRHEGCTAQQVAVSGSMPAPISPLPPPGQYWVTVSVSDRRLDSVTTVEASWALELDIVSALGVPPPPAVC